MGEEGGGHDRDRIVSKVQSNAAASLAGESY